MVIEDMHNYNSRLKFRLLNPGTHFQSQLAIQCGRLRPPSWGHFLGVVNTCDHKSVRQMTFLACRAEKKFNIMSFRSGNLLSYK